MPAGIRLRSCSRTGWPRFAQPRVGFFGVKPWRAAHTASSIRFRAPTWPRRRSIWCLMMASKSAEKLEGCISLIFLRARFRQSLAAFLGAYPTHQCREIARARGAVTSLMFLAVLSACSTEHCHIPSSTPATVGVPYPFSAPLECGGDAVVHFNNRWWRADLPRPSDRPPGCGDRGVSGTMTLRSQDQADFQTREGTVVIFRPTTVGCA